MIDISVDFDDRQVVQALDRLANVKPIMADAIDETQDFIMQLWEYQQNRRPQKPPGSTYTRTFRLKRSRKKSTIQGSGSQLTASVRLRGSVADYNIFVKSAESQARIHRGRWATDQQDADDAAKFLNNKIVALVDRAIREFESG